MKIFKNIMILVFCILCFTDMKAHAVKIGLLIETDRLLTGTSTTGIITDEMTGKNFCKLDAMKPYVLTPGKKGIKITVNGEKHDIASERIVVRTATPGFVSAKNRWYRGTLIVRKVNGKLTVINNIPLEEYLLGVVPSEMPSSWHSEALKAQAVAARSYAVANLGKQSRYGFDLKDNTEDQAYGGASAETARARTAVEQTAGIVITQNKEVVPAFYCASAGGKTVNAGKIWSKDLPYLRSVPSFDGGMKKMGHGLGMSQHGCNNLAKQGYNAYQILMYYYNNIKFGRLLNNSV